MKKLMLALMMLTSTMAFANQKILTLRENTTINFNSAFSGRYVAQKQVEAITKCALSPNSEILITFYSPGGSVSAGHLFFDTLNALPCKFNTLTIFGASMSYQAVQNLGTRYMIPSGILMSHRAYVSGLSGEIGGELDSIVKLLKSNIENLDKIAAKRVGISLKDYQELVRDELWLTAEQAVKTNHADEIVLAKCDDTLSGSYSKTFDTFFGSYEVEFSNCPLIVAPLSVKASNSESNSTDFFNYFTNIKDRINLER